MCGRYVLTVPGDLLASAFGLEEAPELAPRYNVAPSQAVPIVRAGENGRRELASTRPFGVTVWGWAGAPEEEAIAHLGPVSYAFPAGASLRSINDVILVPPAD